MARQPKPIEPTEKVFRHATAFMFGMLASSLVAAVAIIVASLFERWDLDSTSVVELPGRFRVIAIFVGLLAAIPVLVTRVLGGALGWNGPWIYVAAGVLFAFASYDHFSGTFEEVALAAGITGSAQASGTIGALVGLVFWFTGVWWPSFWD